MVTGQPVLAVHHYPLMNLRISLPVLLLAAINLISTAAHGGVAQDVAAYDAILADVRQGQKTITLGDMIVPVATVSLWRDRLANAKKPVAEIASQTGITQWPGGNVYYAFNANVSAANQAAFLDGAREWETFANVHFIPRASQPNYIMVNDGGPGLSGGNSALGMIGGAQQLTSGRRVGTAARSFTNSVTRSGSSTNTSAATATRS